MKISVQFDRELQVSAEARAELNEWLAETISEWLEIFAPRETFDPTYKGECSERH